MIGLKNYRGWHGDQGWKISKNKGFWCQTGGVYLDVQMTPSKILLGCWKMPCAPFKWGGCLLPVDVACINYFFNYILSLLKY